MCSNVDIEVKLETKLMDKCVEVLDKDYVLDPFLA